MTHVIAIADLAEAAARYRGVRTNSVSYVALAMWHRSRETNIVEVTR